MPRYFFHVRNQTDYTRDQVGVDLIDLAHARRYAADAVGQILTTDLGQEGRDTVVFRVQVEQEPGVRVLNIDVRGTVKPVTSPSVRGADSAD